MPDFRNYKLLCKKNAVEKWDLTIGSHRHLTNVITHTLVNDMVMVDVRKCRKLYFFEDAQLKVKTIIITKIELLK